MAKKTTKSDSAQEEITPKKGRPKKAEQQESTVAQTEVKKTKSKSKKSESNQPSVEEQIYGTSSDRIEALPFPVTDFQTQTKNIIKEYGINVSLLPKEITMAVNTMISDFTYFVENPQNYGMVGAIMDKDLIAVNMLKAWIEPRKQLLLDNKIEEKEEIKVLPPVTSGNFTNTQINTPAPIPNAHSVHPSTFHPRTPENTYTHSFGVPPSTMENKDVHYQVLAQADSSIKAANHAHQNWQGQVSETPFVIDRQKIFNDYCITINDTIKSSFQYVHWGFIPESDLRGIISQLDQSYQYNVVLSGEQSYVEITNGTDVRNTDFFSVK